MTLNLPPNSETKPKPSVSTAALAARLETVERLLNAIADSYYGKNVRPPLPADDEESGE